MELQLKNVRLAFPQLFEPRSVNGEGEPAFSATFIITPEQKALIEKIEEAIATVAKDKWKTKADIMLKQIKAADKVCLHDGDTKADYAGFPGNLYIAARSKTRPTVIDRDRSHLTPADGKPYGGCYVNAVIDIWAQDNNFGKRVCASLSGVQFFKDGEAFSGGKPADPTKFEEYADDDDDDLV